MKTIKTKRIYYLDSLRATMMLLGVVLHSALTYNITEHHGAWVIKDPISTNIITDFLILIIHSFRMPIFFVVAGFFGALLFYERGHLKMIKNRISRIVLPFIFFLFFLSPITYFSFKYTNISFSQTENPLNLTILFLKNLKSIIPNNTEHLWFLYYLIFTTITSVTIALLLTNSKKTKIILTKKFNWIIQENKRRIFFFSGITFVLLFSLGTPIITISNSLIPEIKTFLFHFFFYAFGWVLYKSKHLLKTFTCCDKLYTIMAVILTSIQGLIMKEYSDINTNPTIVNTLLIALSSVTVWLYIFGITGLFIRYTDNNSKTMRYLSDSSYWVYLMHYPLTAIIPGLIWQFPLSAISKFLIVLISTTIICFITYHFGVRNTFIGEFLNGRKYPQKKLMNS